MLGRVGETSMWSMRDIIGETSPVSFRRSLRKKGPFSGGGELNYNVKQQPPRYLPLDCEYYGKVMYRIWYNSLKAVKIKSVTPYT